MYDVGSKFEINPAFKGVAEIIGIYPGAQEKDQKEKFQVMIDGNKVMLTKEIVDILFKEVVCQK